MPGTGGRGKEERTAPPVREGSPEADLVAYLGRLALVSSTRVEGSEHRTAAGSLVEYQVRLLLIFRRHDAVISLRSRSPSSPALDSFPPPWPSFRAPLSPQRELCPVLETSFKTVPAC